MDPALITPLTEITDYLLRCKPGIVSIANIVRISQYYGFETFNENNRLTIAGKIILIDIDYREELIDKVNISLAVDLQNDPFNFIKAFDTLLYNNLKEATLYKFNNNFKKLSVLDKFSSLKFDLFNFLNQEVTSFPDIQLNMNDDLGYYMKIYQGSQYINQHLQTPQLNNFYLEIMVKETIKDPMINDLKCGICLELLGDDYNGILIPEIVLLKAGISVYDTYVSASTLSIPASHDGYKIISVLGSPLVNLRRFYLPTLAHLDTVLPVLKNWYLINDLFLRALIEPPPVRAPGSAVTDEKQQEQRQEAAADGEVTAEQQVQVQGDDGVNDISLDDYLSQPPRGMNAKLIELVLMHNEYLQITVNHEIRLVVKDAQVTSTTHSSLADKLNKVQDLYRVLKTVAVN